MEISESLGSAKSETFIPLGNALLTFLGKQQGDKKSSSILAQHGLAIRFLTGDFGEDSMESLKNALDFKRESSGFDKVKLIQLIGYIFTNPKIFHINNGGLSSLMLVACQYPELRTFVLALGDEIFLFPKETQVAYICILQGSIGSGVKDGKGAAKKILMNPLLDYDLFGTLVCFLIKEGETEFITQKVVLAKIHSMDQGEQPKQEFYNEHIKPLLQNITRAKDGMERVLVG